MHRYVLGLLAFTSPLAAGEVADLAAQSWPGGGTVAVIGTLPADELVALSAGGTRLVQALTTDAAAADRLRTELARAGAFPLADAQWVPELKRLPYADRIVSIVIDAGGGAAADELERITAFGGVRLTKSGGWRATPRPMPADTDDWNHSFRGPNRLPVSNDAWITPITGVAWIAGGDPKGPLWGQRIDDGRLFELAKLPKDDTGEKDETTWLLARDAQSGVLLWKRKVNIRRMQSSSGSFFASSQSFVAANGRVYCFLEEDGPLVALDAATGKDAVRYEQAGRLKPATRPNREGKPETTEPDGLGSSATLVSGDGLLLTMRDTLWMMEAKTGTVRWQVQAKDGAAVGCPVWQPDGPDAGIYYIERKGGDRFLVRLDLAGKRLWETNLEELPGGMITAPQNGRIMVQFAMGSYRGTDPRKDGVAEFRGKGSMLHVYQTSDGKQLWEKGSPHPFRHRAWLWNDDFYVQGGSDAVHRWDAQTAKVKGSWRYRPYGQGCPICVFTTKWIIRGTQLSPHSDPNQLFAAQGFRQNCEMPTLPAYGKLYSQGSHCGCMFFLPGGNVSAYTAATVQPWADAQRLRRDGAPRAEAALTLTGPLAEDAKYASSYLVDKPGKMGNAGPILPGKLEWYDAKELTAEGGGVTIASVVHEGRVVCRAGGAARWSALVGGRPMYPAVVGDLAVVPCTDGWIYAFKLADGALAWRYLAAPEARTQVVYGRFESAWPVMGVLLHDGKIIYSAGRVPTLDEGMWVGALDPATGGSAWRVRAVQYPVIDNAGEKRDKNDKTVPAYANVANITPNAPPRLIDGKLRWLGLLAIDPANPKDVIVNAEKRLVPEEHRRVR